MPALFDDIIFGPIRSRRLGLSLGVNLLPTNSKICSFECIYCECGWRGEGRGDKRFNSRDDVRTLLYESLEAMVTRGEIPDVITFAGNGEPTMHPEFEAIIDDTISVRDSLSPTTKISVLSNATQLHREGVVTALKRVDNNILKIDSAFDATAHSINLPNGEYSVAKVVEQMAQFNGEMIIQTMFLRGEYEGKRIDNTTQEELLAWLELIAKVQPRSVMIYSLDRATPCKTLEKVSSEELKKIAQLVEKLGIECHST